MPIPVSGFSHVRITVTDIERSKRFYDDVLGLPVAFQLPPDADEKTREENWWLFGGVVYQVPGGFFGLRPVAPAGDSFTEDRAGLDHLSFEDAIREADVSRTAAYRCWPHKDAFLADLAVELAEQAIPATPTRGTRGTAMIRTIVTAHAGRVAVVSGTGGTRIGFVLPAVSVPARVAVPV